MCRHNLTSAYEQAVRERCSFNERVFLRSQSATIDDFGRRFLCLEESLSLSFRINVTFSTSYTYWQT
jgi:hypothetical protein